MCVYVVIVFVCLSLPPTTRTLARSLSELTLIKTKRNRYKGYRNVCLYVFCACVVDVLLRRLCVSSFILFSLIIKMRTILHAFLRVSFISQITLSAPFVSGSLSLLSFLFALFYFA